MPPASTILWMLLALADNPNDKAKYDWLLEHADLSEGERVMFKSPTNLKRLARSIAEADLSLIGTSYRVLEP